MIRKRYFVDAALNHAIIIPWEKLYYSDVVLLSFDRLVAESVHDDNQAEVLTINSRSETASIDVLCECGSEGIYCQRGAQPTRPIGVCIEECCFASKRSEVF